MMRRSVVIIIFAILFFSLIPMSASGSMKPTNVVSMDNSASHTMKEERVLVTFPMPHTSAYSETLNVPTDFPTIQAAVNSAYDGDTIFVSSGTYFENVVINKTLSLVGENKETTIIDGNGVGSGVGIALATNNVTFQNFTIQNFDIEGGIVFQSANHCIIDNNHIIDNINGISFLGVNEANLITNNILMGNGKAIAPYGSGVLNASVIYQNQIVENDVGLSWGLEGHSWINISIHNNLFTDNAGAAIAFTSYKARIEEITISGNEIRNNQQGIYIQFGCPNFTIINNSISDNEGIGIDLEYSISNATISGNLIENNLGGIRLNAGPGDGSSAFYNTIYDNAIIMNREYGIYFYGASNNTISNNVISGNVNGLVLTNRSFDGTDYQFSNYNLIIENHISYHRNHGIQMIRTSDNRLYHNNFTDNMLHVYSDDSMNFWDNGYPTGGNYWSTYVDADLFSGPYQDEPGSDGIWDTPYVLDTDNQDNYPLIEHWTHSPPANLYLVVHGLNDNIYLRQFDPIEDSWDNWIPLPGSTVDTPAAAVLNEQVHIIVRGMDGQTLWHGYHDLSSDTFSGWMMLHGSTPSTPVLTSNGTMLCLVVQGMNNLIYYCCYTDGSWEDWQQTPTGSTMDTPAGALLGDELHIIVRGMDETSLWHAIFDPIGEVIQPWNGIPGSSPSNPVLTASQMHNELYMLVRGDDDSLYYQAYSGSADVWEGGQGLPGSTTLPPCATISGDQLHLVVGGVDEITLWHSYIDVDSDAFSGWSWISGSTPSAPTLTS